MDPDFIFNRYRDQIRYFSTREGGQLAVSGGSGTTSSTDGSLILMSGEDGNTPGSEDATGLSASTQMLAQEEEAYRRLSQDAHDKEWAGFAGGIQT